MVKFPFSVVTVIFISVLLVVLLIFTSSFTQDDNDHFVRMTGYYFSEEPAKDGSKFRLLHPKKDFVTFEDALQLLESEESNFRDMLSEILQRQEEKMSAYYWECPPVSQETIGKVAFEFVLLPAQALLHKVPDLKAFEAKFRDTNSDIAATFRSLGGDAVLIAPKPYGTFAPEVYMHLASFVKSADPHQVSEYWKIIARTLRSTLSSSKLIWLSTSGAGVQWLHVRLDSRPKYYNWDEYTTVSSHVL